MLKDLNWKWSSNCYVSQLLLSVPLPLLNCSTVVVSHVGLPILLLDRSHTTRPTLSTIARTHTRRHVTSLHRSILSNERTAFHFLFLLPPRHLGQRHSLRQLGVCQPDHCSPYPITLLWLQAELSCGIPILCFDHVFLNRKNNKGIEKSPGLLLELLYYF